MHLWRERDAALHVGTLFLSDLSGWDGIMTMT